MTIVLRGMTWEHDRGYGSVAAAAEAYKKVRPDVEVLWQFRSLQAFADQPIDDLARDFDLLVIDHPHIPIAAELGAFAHLDGRGYDHELAVLGMHSVGASHRSYRHNGHQYGLATDAAAQVAAYRPDALSQPPTSWDEVLELAAESCVVWPAKPIDALSSLITVATNHGSPPFATPGVFLTAEQAAPALDILHRLAANVPESNLTWNPIQAADALAGENSYLYSPLLFGYSNYSRAGFRANRLRYVDIPAGPRGVSGSLLGGAGIAVSAFSAHLDEAVAHAFWLDSPAVQSGVFYDGGGQPGHALAWDNDRLNADSLNFFRGTRATLDGAYVRPRTAGYMNLQDSVSPLVTSALAGEISDATLVARLNDAAEKMAAYDLAATQQAQTETREAS